MRILEATIAVMLVSGVLVVVYSKQVDRGIAPAEYFFSLQRQILADVSSRSDLRLAVLNVYNDTKDSDDENFTMLNDFVDVKVPNAFGFSLQICDLGDGVDHCKLDGADAIRETRDKDVFVEDIVISSELGDGSNSIGGGDAPRKLRFYIWELR